MDLTTIKIDNLEIKKDKNGNKKYIASSGGETIYLHDFAPEEMKIGSDLTGNYNTSEFKGIEYKHLWKPKQKPSLKQSAGLEQNAQIMAEIQELKKAIAIQTDLIKYIKDNLGNPFEEQGIKKNEIIEDDNDDLPF